MSITQTIYKELLDMPVFEATKKGSDDKCWLCGGETEGLGHRLKDVITSAFTDGNLAKVQDSQTICYSCAGLMKKRDMAAGL